MSLYILSEYDNTTKGVGNPPKKNIIHKFITVTTIKISVYSLKFF